MSDDSGPPSNHVHPSQNPNDLGADTADAADATDDQHADTQQMMQDELGMTMEDVDMLNAMHAEGLDANDHVDISALLQSLADQDGLGMEGIDMDAIADQMGEDGGSDGNQVQADVEVHGQDGHDGQEGHEGHEGQGDLGADDDEVQADQDALLAAVRALEGMGGEDLALGDETMDLDIPDLSDMGQAEMDALGADLISAIEGVSQQAPYSSVPPVVVQQPTFVRSTTPTDVPPQSLINRYRYAPPTGYRPPAQQPIPSVATSAPSTGPIQKQQVPAPVTSSTGPGSTGSFSSSIPAPVFAPLQMPVSAAPASPGLPQLVLDEASSNGVEAVPAVPATATEAPAGADLPATHVSVPVSEAKAVSPIGATVPGPDAALPASATTIMPTVASSLPLPAPPIAEPPAITITPSVPTSMLGASQEMTPVQAPAILPSIALSDAPVAPIAVTPAAHSASAPPTASQLSTTQPVPTATPTMSADPVPIPASGEIDEALLDPQLFADSEGFDPDTLANLAALSRIANEEDDDVAVGAPEGDSALTGPDAAPGIGVGADELTVPSADRNRRRKSRAQEPELSRDQVRALVEGLSKGDKERRGDAEAGDRAEDEQGDAAARPGSEMKADEDDPRSKEEQLTEVGEADKEDLKDRDYQEEGQDDGKKKRKRKRNRTTLSCTECHRRCDRNIPCSRCVARGVPSLCKMEYPDLPPPPKKKKHVNPLPINHELGLRVQALEILLRAGSNMDSGAANVAAMDTILQATRAAQAGNLDAGNALASLTTAAGGDLSKMEAAEQNGLLMEVLQQLSSASMARTTEKEEIPEATDDPWSTVPEAAIESLLKDPDTDNDKEAEAPSEPYINLAVPGFREDNGNIFIPPTVRYIEKKMRDENILAKEPLSIQGDPKFLAEATTFAYGADAPAIKKDLVASIQSISISGALRIASAFLSRFPSTSSSRVIYVPDPISWEDEAAIKSAGAALEVRRMRFLDTRGNGVDWEGMREDLMSATPGSAVMLYVGGSMPCGAELSASLWRLLALILLERQLIPLCILAFQGLASGDPSRDAQPMRFMVHEGLPVLAIQSFDSTMGIHADSPSMLSLVTQSAEVKQRVESQFRAIAKGMYLHPTPWGAHVVQAVMKNQRIYTAWLAEIKAMSDRLRSVRDKLYDVLVNKQQTPGNWLHVKRAHGMYCSTMMNPRQVRLLAKNKNIHLLPDGSVSLGSLNAQRIDTLAKAIDAVVRISIKEAEEARQRAIAMEEALTAAREAAAKAEADAAAEAAARAAKEAESRAREEDAAFMEQSIAEAMMRQAEEVQERQQAMEREREDEMRDMDEAIKRAQASVDVQRRAEEILAGISQASHGGPA